MPILEAPFYLTNNCRNTAPIHELAYQYYSGEEIDVPDLQGPDISWLDAVTGSDQASAIVARVVQWIGRDGLKHADITILLAKNSKNYAFDLLTEAAKNSSINFVIADHSSTGGVLVETVARFKGLETHAAVLWVGDEVVDEEKKETMYVGVTRAKSLLVIVGSNRALKKLRAYAKN